MGTCGHEECYISTPPVLEFMLEEFPLVIPNEIIDRSIPRCKLCDLIAASTRESTAVYPPPTYSSPIEGLQNHIASAEQLIGEGIRKEELEATLPSMKQILADEIRATELRMLEVWKEHWAIWGPGEGPEVPNEYPTEVVLEDVVEEYPKDTGGKKRKAPLNMKGRAPGKRARKA
ncbi:hypothetical protein N431DRAFT_493499 [Stipitochalara longipes BDJ]|nr:hypothetical protein N431DRAFT_493499 [Stipitochalara longipes BDJ]